MSYIPGSLLRKLLPKATSTPAREPTLGPVWEVAEGVSGTWHYHVRDVSLAHPLSQPAACGARVMQTQIPLSAWGTVGHLNEKWCAECAERAGIQIGDSPKPNG